MAFVFKWWGWGAGVKKKKREREQNHSDQMVLSDLEDPKMSTD